MGCIFYPLFLTFQTVSTENDTTIVPQGILFNDSNQASKVNTRTMRQLSQFENVK
jgi:hypothetical protein